MTNLEMDSARIPAHSRRQAMDWALVLASQDIATVIDRGEDDHWILVVSASDRERALNAIRQYRLENRRWAWRQVLPGSDLTFHWGGLLWCILLIAIYRMSSMEWPGLLEAWEFDSAAAARGEWWRAFTAILLHADLAHLLTNIATGVVLFGLALARYGPGPALLSAYLAGAAGNLAGLLLYPKPYHGLGASGMVMGALGLIAMPGLTEWRNGPRAFKRFARGLGAALLLFVILGTNPSSDVVAHAGGFVAGAMMGAALGALPAPIREHRWAISGCWLALGLLLLRTAWMGLYSQ